MRRFKIKSETIKIFDVMRPAYCVREKIRFKYVTPKEGADLGCYFSSLQDAFRAIHQVVKGNMKIEAAYSKEIEEVLNDKKTDPS
jgi:hypothetical protein